MRVELAVRVDDAAFGRRRAAADVDDVRLAADVADFASSAAACRLIFSSSVVKRRPAGMHAC